VLVEVGDRARNKLFLAEGVLRAVEGLPEPHAADAERDGPA